MGLLLKRSTAFGPMTLENGMKKLNQAPILLSTEKFVCLVMSSIIMMFQ
jgi:hypothetical protein